MRDGIHPDYPTATIACACGNTFVTHSTRGDFQVDVCGACHPFYTGTQKLLDTAGRVDRFRKRYQTKPAPAKAAAVAAAAPAAAPSEGPAAKAEATPAPEAEGSPTPTA
jgi:large subunit ribosomal protein L31